MSQQKVTGYVDHDTEERIDVDANSYICVWESKEEGFKHPYPWRFSFTLGKETYRAIGVRNYCGTRHHAICRARTKLRQLKKERQIEEIRAQLPKYPSIDGDVTGIVASYDELTR